MKSYGLDYVAGSTAKKIYYEEEPLQVKRVKKQSKSVKPSINIKQKIQLVAGVVAVFTVFMVIIYRSNMISEANLKVIELKAQLEEVSSDLSLAMMSVEQGQNLTEIEAYAKQKLGMQKPDKNQIVYVDTSTVSEVKVNEDKNIASSVLDNIKNFFGIK